MRYYTRKTKRGLVPAELMQAAAHEVLNRGASMKKTAKENNICSTTLFRFIRKIKSGETPTVGYKPRLLFSRDQEQEILKHLSEYAKVFCGLTLDDVRTFACQFAIRMKYTNIPRSWFKNGKASKDWADKFATRHQLPLKPMKEVIDINKCYSILHKVMERHKFLQSRIYHLVDMSIVTKVVKSKAYANGRVLMSVGQRKPVNVQFAANAEGETVPPMFVTDEYKATNVIKNSSGCMTVKDFTKYLNHFVKHTMPNEADPVLLLIDEQQYLDVNVLERARANSVILLSFPVSHNIQPLKKIANNILESCKAQVGTPRSTPDGECDILEIASKVIAEVRKSAIVKCFRKTGVWPFNPNVVTGEDFVPTAVKEYDFKVSEQEAQPGPSKILDTTTPLDSSGKEQDPLSRVIEQCRFCGEFSKDCVAVSSDMTYLAGNKTTLALNDTSVQLDFNDASLPKTVCRDCDAKLQEFCDFVKVVKAAQCTLNNVAEEKAEFETGAEFEEPAAGFEESTADFEESTAEYEELEMLVVKTEDSDDDKEGIVDPLAVGENVFVNETHKRKSDTDKAKTKKLKAKEKCDYDFVISVKQEVVEKDTNEQSEVSDTEIDVKPSELELTRSALVFQMAGDGTSEYQEHQGDR